MEDWNWSALGWFFSNNWKPVENSIFESETEFFWKKWSDIEKWWWWVKSVQFEDRDISISSTCKNKEILSSKQMIMDSITADRTAKFLILFIHLQNYQKLSIRSKLTDNNAGFIFKTCMFQYYVQVARFLYRWVRIIW